MTDPNQEVASAPAADQSPTPGAPAATTDTKQEAGEVASQPKQVPSMGRIVITRREHHGTAPGIVTAVREDGSIDVQIFKADHMTHTAESMAEVKADDESAVGWFWPPRTAADKEPVKPAAAKPKA